MLRKLRTRIKGQSTAEYAILIALVVAAIIAMQKYAQRALQARVRDAALYMVNETSELGNSVQYEPYYLTTNYTINRSGSESVRQDTDLVGMNGSSATEREKGGATVYEFNTADIKNREQ